MIVDQHQQDEALIAAYIEPHPARDGITEARIKGHGAPVWALIARYRVTPDEDAADRVAQAYGIAPEAMQAAIAYYRKYSAEINQRLADLLVP